MDAQILRFSLLLLSLFVSTGATYQTPNFVVSAPTQAAAERVGRAAETYRHELAVFWLNQPLPNWSRPCKLRVRVGTMGAGGETKFQFAGGHVMNWDMYVQGSMERILDSVLPHEVNHTIFACHFRRPLPRWADEGAATLFEHRSEQLKQLGLLNQVIKNDREFISLRNLLTMKEYPRAYRPMLILYAEGYALADFLLQQGGRKRYLKFLADGEKMGWPQAIKANYHHGGVESLQKNWQSWVLAGMPKLRVSEGQMLAQNTHKRHDGLPRPAILEEYAQTSTVRSQSPDAETSRRSTTEASGRSRTATTRSAPEDASRARILSRLRTRQTPSPAPTVFVGLPVKNATGKAAAVSFRNASFEAPRPRAANPRAASPSSRRQSSQYESVAPRGAGKNDRPVTDTPGSKPQRTHLSQTSESTDLFAQRKHLPQERNVLTGSIPQWAGFPGQKELF